MASHTSSSHLHLAASNREPLIAGAVAIHVGLGIICASAIYTGWQSSVVSRPQWGAMLLVAAALLYAGLTGGPAMARRTWVRLTLGFGGLLVFGLCYDPQLAAIPRLGEDLPSAFADTYPGVALIGAIIAFAGWLAYRGAGGEMGHSPAPMRRSAAASIGLVVALAAFSYAMLHRAHELPASATWRPILMALQGGSLAVILPGIGGGPGIRKAPHLYLGAALILAFLRNMAFPMQ